MKPFVTIFLFVAVLSSTPPTFAGRIPGPVPTSGPEQRSVRAVVIQTEQKQPNETIEIVSGK